MPVIKTEILPVRRATEIYKICCPASLMCIMLKKSNRIARIIFWVTDWEKWHVINSNHCAANNSDTQETEGVGNSTHFMFTFSLHSSLQTALVATCLTTITLALVNDTVIVLSTSVFEIFTNCSLEESLTTFTAEQMHSSRTQQQLWQLHTLYIKQLLWAVH